MPTALAVDNSNIDPCAVVFENFYAFALSVASALGIGFVFALFLFLIFIIIYVLMAVFEHIKFAFLGVGLMSVGVMLVGIYLELFALLSKKRRRSRYSL